MQSLVRWNRKVFCFLALLLAVPCPSLAQKAVVEESVTEINCDSRTHAVMRFRQVTTILNAQGASLASFGGNDRLTSVGQLAHVILEVPLLGDTLWLECPPPRLPAMCMRTLQGTTPWRLARRAAFVKAVDNAFSQKIVIKKISSHETNLHIDYCTGLLDRSAGPEPQIR